MCGKTTVTECALKTKSITSPPFTDGAGGLAAHHGELGWAEQLSHNYSVEMGTYLQSLID